MSLELALEELMKPHFLWNTSNNILREVETKTRGVTPRVDMYNTENGAELKVDLPGYDKKDLQVGITDGVLTLTGERRNTVNRSDTSHHYCERLFGSFTRRLTLPFNVDPSLVVAKFENGVLSVTLPRVEEKRDMISIE